MVTPETIVFHWTTRQQANTILKMGLRQWSFVCRNPKDWRGEVCLSIKLPYEIDWDSRDEHATWQAIVPDSIDPEFITEAPALSG